MCRKFGVLHSRNAVGIDESHTFHRGAGTLRQVRKLLAARAVVKLEIRGHTNHTGMRPHNDTLRRNIAGRQDLAGVRRNSYRAIDCEGVRRYEPVAKR